MKLRPRAGEAIGKKLGQQTGQTDAEKSAEGVRILEMVRGDDWEALTQADRVFLADMYNKYEQFKDKLLVTGRQLFWLRDIKDKLI